MGNFFQKGNSTGEALAALGIVIVLMVLSALNPAPRSPNTSPRPLGSSPFVQGGSLISSTSSSYSRNITLNVGNARYSYQPSEEYISIYNSNREPINITGWQVKNGMDKRTYYIGGNLQRFPAQSVLIGQGARLLSPWGTNFMENIVLAQGETAVITTGRSASQLPYQIVSFKENMCTGYLDAMPEYSFTPPLNRICPRPADEPGVEWLDTECRTFISRLPSCQPPDFTQRDRRNEPCTNCVNRTPVSGACLAFIKERFNYQGCVANHAAHPNFYGRTWRVFLGQGWEMWNSEYETIEILDQFGRSVTSRSY